MSKKLNKLFKEDISEYIEMFNSADSDDVIYLLREVHRTRSYESMNLLVNKLDKMLELSTEE